MFLGVCVGKGEESEVPIQAVLDAIQEMESVRNHLGPKFENRLLSLFTYASC